MDTKQPNGSGQHQEQLDSKVIPVMREAVAAVQLILYGELKKRLSARYADLDETGYRRLVGCIVNDIFGTPAMDSESVRFARKNMDTVEDELKRLVETVSDLLPVLTDALRMQTLCDHEEGVNSLPTLLRARALSVLQEERPIPLPSTFMILVRQMGAKYGLISEMQAKDPAAGSQE